MLASMFEANGGFNAACRLTPAGRRLSSYRRPAVPIHEGYPRRAQCSVGYRAALLMASRRRQRRAAAAPLFSLIARLRLPNVDAIHGTNAVAKMATHFDAPPQSRWKRLMTMTKFVPRLR
jgi:hypothetical protein